MTIPLGEALKDQRGRNLGGVQPSREKRQAFGHFKLTINEQLERFAKAVEEERYTDATAELELLTANWKQGVEDYGV